MAEVRLHGQQPLDGLEPEPEPAVAAGSIVSRLRAQAKAQQEAKRTEIRVGGEFQNLYIRYKPLAPAQMDKFVASRQGVKIQDISATSATMDMMARACVEVVGRFGDEEEVLEDEDGPVKLDYRLAVLLDMPRAEGVKPTSHEVISALFGHNGAMIAQHGDVLTEWMMDPSNREVEQSVGEG